MPIRPLTNELQKIAEREINEVPSQVQENLDHIRDWISKQPHLKARTDDQWLLAFLRCCKFSLERTKEKLDLFYTMRKLVPELFASRDPFSAEIQDVLKEGVLAVLPKTANSTEPAMLVLQIGHVVNSERLHIISLFKVILMILEILFLEDDNCTVCGEHAIFNLNNMSYKHVLQITPALAKKAAMCVEKAYPTRVKGVHYINAPSYYVAIFNTIKIFLSEKMNNRIIFHPEADLASLHKAVPPSILPKEYGGEAGSFAELAAQVKVKVESYREWFLEDSQYCTDETKRVGKPKTTEEMFGLEGSFRKLEFD